MEEEKEVNPAQPTPRIFGMCLVKNEADIVLECLKSASEWCHQVFVYDNGSDDGTWGIVCRLAEGSKSIIPFKSTCGRFTDSLRGEIFEHYRYRSTESDWWCRLDADEFYIDDPRFFLAEVPSVYHVVWSASFQYYFTEKDLARLEVMPAVFADGSPIREKCKYYVNNWSEPRFFRYSSALTYHDSSWPRPLGPPYRRRIRLKHFQYRSPSQIAKRLSTRLHTADGVFGHEKGDWFGRVFRDKAATARPPLGITTESWGARIVNSRILTFDDGAAEYKTNESALPPIRRFI